MGKKISIVLLMLMTVWVCHGGTKATKPFVTREKWSSVAKAYDFSEHYKDLADSKSTPKVHKNPFSWLRFSNFSFTGIFLMVVVVAALVVLVVVLIRSIVRSNNEKLSNKGTGLPVAYDHIEDADLESDLRFALDQRLFREAIRIRYLMLIKNLNQQGWITWKKDKTNGAYIREMYGKPGNDHFRKLTHAFEKTWYGDRLPLEGDYQQLIPEFNRMNLILSGNE